MKNLDSLLTLFSFPALGPTEADFSNADMASSYFFIIIKIWLSEKEDTNLYFMQGSIWSEAVPSVRPTNS